MVKADIVPFQDGSNSSVKVEIYVVTGNHGGLRIPESFCKECNLFYREARKAADSVDEEVSIQVKSYWTRFARPLLKGGYHPPVMLLNGELVSQGYEVPDHKELASEIESLHES